MAIRKPLRDKLTASWDAVVSVDYTRQRINSERSLQASLWSQLNKRLEPRFRMFIEPRFTLSDGKFMIPDIVICNSRSIICVIEIKYWPRAKMKFGKDLRSLDRLAREGTSLSVSNDRFTGPKADDGVYGFANKTLFAWAGFHRPPNDATYARLPSIAADFPSLKGRFMQLHAETNDNNAPTVFHRIF